MSRTLRIALVVIVVASVSALAAFALLGGGSALDGTSWRLTEWSVSSLAPGGFTITAKFADGQISGTSAVNSYGGPYKAGLGGSFSAGPITATKMGGPEASMRAEQIFFALLDQAGRYSREGNTLTLSDQNGNPRLIFGAAK